MKSRTFSRRLPIGAEVQPEGGVHFRVWAPQRSRVAVIAGSRSETVRTFPLQAEAHGYHAGWIGELTAESRYSFRLDDDETLYPDPASRYQPEGPHGPSQVIDPSRFHWTDQQWPGIRMPRQVIYELHLGTFTRSGGWAAAADELPELAKFGITVVEIMPIADFPGRFGWGYDGVNLFAPTRLYGTPDDARRFIDKAHNLGIGVILDVVYNHLGPDGNYLEAFAADYFTDRYKTDWGRAINYDGPGSGPVREYFLANAGFWIDEYHFDGLRLDATQNIYDTSPDSILTAMNRRVREAARGRATIIVTENEPQQVKLIQPPEQNGHGFDGMWNDDFHHSAQVALSGRGEAYFTDYLGTPQEFISMAKRGFLYQGQHYRWQKKRRGSQTTGLPSSAFITFLENHDQVANSGYGYRSRVLASPGRHRALTALWLLSPGTPMFFQGQEFSATSPFLFFADHHPELANMVHKGRKEFLAQFPSLANPAMQGQIDSPASLATFERCKLDFTERQKHAPSYTFHRDLVRLRRDDPAFDPETAKVDGAVLATHAFVLRFLSADGGDRLLLVNLGRDLLLNPAPEPLLAPRDGCSWQLLWSSEDPRYGGDGATPTDDLLGWHLPGEAAAVMRLHQEG